jgi:hypothetical protein
MRALGKLLSFSAFCALLWLIAHARLPEVLDAVASATGPNYQLLTNPGMESFDASYGRFHDVDCQVANGWQRFWLEGPAPCWMDTRVFADSHLGGGWVERIEGDTSQMMVSTQPYTAGLWQRATGLTPGAGYGFHAALLTIYQTSYGEADNNKMFKQVGIDPAGGSDPSASTVVWSEADGRDMRWSIDLRTAVWAETEAATVFIRVISPYEAGAWPYMNQSFLDSAILARTPSVMASSPRESELPTFQVRWDGAVAAPGGGTLRWYDIQWMDEAEGVWRDWLTRIGLDQVEATFTGERHHAYRFRARAWQRYPNGAHLVSPYRPDGDTRTLVLGPQLAGCVMTHGGQSLVGATVSILGTEYWAVSGGGGLYEIWPMPSEEPRSIAVEHPVWLSPAPVHGVVFGPTDRISLDWTLRPPDDAVQNGGFESDLYGWSIPDGQEGTPSLVTTPVHTGEGAVALGGDVRRGDTTVMSQTVALEGSWEPALAFWYRPANADPDGDRFQVFLDAAWEMSRRVPEGGMVLGPKGGFDRLDGQAKVKTYVITPSLESTDWQHATLSLGTDEYLTGTVTLRFQMWDDGDATATTVYVDEVGLGKTPGGPHKSYLPLIAWRK